MTTPSNAFSPGGDADGSSEEEQEEIKEQKDVKKNVVDNKPKRKAGAIADEVATVAFPSTTAAGLAVNPQLFSNGDNKKKRKTVDKQSKSIKKQIGSK